ncbi:MAG: bacteriohopanetetrol glucosamine biosynthesis glycosyltransferase HpnI [Rhodospirillales bacterium]|nr:bacteriohopanetetrol glucosamine biosynthesis glycosyltransferase HpnI [Rhodospirillales bacterium]MDE2199398.1 bacteriohopanetetrol glucosamine biosynthesis glycosyltransferase HpnI [Rhodospirillales bacterium]
MVSWLAVVLAVLTGIGLAQAGIGAALVWRFVARRPDRPRGGEGVARPPLAILKPLHGDEPLLEEALASLCAQDYPSFQIVFGVQRPDDPALAVVARLRARFPARDIALVIDTATHGANRKIGNLINMLPSARHERLVIADSDVHAPPGYLDRIAAGLAAPGVGLVTLPYAGCAASATLAGRLGASGISHVFLPGALTARALGRQDCLGATMALSRATLARIGGLEALADHLADDHLLGLLVARLGLSVALGEALPTTTVAETGFAALLRHELRWARTIRALEPAAFALSVLQYPLAWAALAVAAGGVAPWSLGLFLAAWALRAAAAGAVDAAIRAARAETGLASAASLWLLPLRDLISVGVLLAAFAGSRVEWRGQILHATPAKLGTTLP